MGRFIIRQRMQRAQKRPKRRKLFSIEIANFLILATIAVLGTFFVTKMNHSSSKGYVIKELSTHIENLQTEKERMESKLTALQALPQVKQASGNLGLVPIEKIDYISTFNGPVAKR